MWFKTGLAAAALFAMAAPALAATCNEPVAPIISVNGATATETQMKDAISDFKLYQGAADGFQDCINAEVHRLVEAAKNSPDKKPVDPSILSAYKARQDAVQAEKEKLGGQLNAQIIAYRSAHPKH